MREEEKADWRRYMGDVLSENWILPLDGFFGNREETSLIQRQVVHILIKVL